MSPAAKIYVAMNLDKAPWIRMKAAAIVAVLMIELNRDGYCEPSIQLISRLSRRFRLGDFVTALSAHYPIKT